MSTLQIRKLQISNFLTGLVFWYGIEKLFMKSIGITPNQIGLLTAMAIAITLILDIPAGMLADKWSRKGMLLFSAFFLGLCSFILGNAHTFGLYILGYLAYQLYVVCTSGIYQAIMYDSLHVLGRAKHYGKVNGLAYALFLCGAGVANILSGFIGDKISLRSAYFISIVPAILNILLLSTISEPAYHKPEHKERLMRQVATASKVLFMANIIKVLVVASSLLTVVEVFKSDFGQLYILRYSSSAYALGLLWAVYAFAWAGGSYVAHKIRNSFRIIALGVTLPVILMSFIDNRLGVVLFMIQAFAAGIFFNKVDQQIQDATPSHVRSSVLSLINSLGRAVSVPGSLLIGWIINNHGAFRGAQFAGVLSFAALALLISKHKSSLKPVK